MTREDLKGIIEGITDEQLRSVLDINTADIGKAKGDFAALEAENKTLKADKEKLESKISELSEQSGTAADYKKQLEELKADISAKEKAAKAEAADKELTEAIEAVFGDREFTSDYVRRGLLADMKEQIADPGNKGKGYGEIFEALIKDKEGLFTNPNPPAELPGMGSVQTGSPSEQAMRSIMGLNPKQDEKGV